MTVILRNAFGTVLLLLCSGAFSPVMGQPEAAPASQLLHVKVSTAVPQPFFEKKPLPLVPGHAVRIVASGRFTARTCDDTLLWDDTSQIALLWNPQAREKPIPWDLPGKIPNGLLAAIDIDRDGRTDLLDGRNAAGPQWFRSNGETGFSAAQELLLSNGKPAPTQTVLSAAVADTAAVLLIEHGTSTPSTLRVATIDHATLRPGMTLGSLAPGYEVLGALYVGIPRDTVSGLVRGTTNPAFLYEYGVRGGRLWSELPEGPGWQRYWIADVNGDLRSDFVAFGGAIGGWWLALGSEFGGLGARITVPLDAENLLFADMDCDDSADAVVEKSADGIATVAYARFSTPVPKVTLLAAEKVVAVTDERGAAEFVVTEGLSSGVTAEHSKFHFALSGSRSFLRQEKSQTELHFTAAATEMNAAGQRFSAGPSLHGPYACLGFTPNNPATQWGTIEGQCPPDHVLLSVSIPKQFPDIAKYAPPVWKCCPLPHEDILLPEIQEAPDACAEDSLAIGVAPGWQCPECAQRLLCQRVDRKKYRLGPATKGVQWGLSRLGNDSAPIVLPSDTPQALRYALGRKSLTSWAANGCLGLPWGSILTRQPNAHSCSHAEFRQLQYAPKAAEEQGAAVQMFPLCSEIADPLSPLSGCNNQTSSSSHSKLQP